MEIKNYGNNTARTTTFLLPRGRYNAILILSQWLNRLTTIRVLAGTKNSHLVDLSM
jgi:hypothetical protein